MTLSPSTAAVLAILGFTLTGCGGGSGTAAPNAAATSAPDTPAGSAVTLAAYSQSRVAAAPGAVAADDTLHAALALAVEMLQSTVNGLQGQSLVADAAIVLPALQAARINVLRSAAAGDTLAQLEAALPAAATREATRALLDGLSTRLWAPTTALVERDFFGSIDTGGSAAEPWRATTIVNADWSDAISALSAYGDVSHLNLVSQTRLVIGQRYDASAPTNGQAVAFEGVGLRSADRWYTAPMLRLEGPGVTLQGGDYVATATWIGNGLWVSLRPAGTAPLFEGLQPATLSSALLAVWSACPSPEVVSTRSTQVWPQITSTLENRSRLPAGISLPYDSVRANLSGLDGGGTFLTEVAHTASLTIDTAGLRVSGAQAMAFTFAAENQYAGGSYGSGFENDNLPPFFPQACPRAEPDWRGAYLALIDRAGRLVVMVTLPDAGSAAVACTPS